MSARNSGVKNFVSYGVSLVRGFPVSQDQSANANGSAFLGFTMLVVFFSAACGWTLVIIATLVTPRDVVSVEVALAARAGVSPEADEESEFVEGDAGAAAVCALLSSSAMRFSSCSTRSKSCRSRSVNAAGASIFTAAGLAGGWSLPSSSANAEAPTALPQKIPANISDPSLFHLKMSILSPSFSCLV